MRNFKNILALLMAFAFFAAIIIDLPLGAITHAEAIDNSGCEAGIDAFWNAVDAGNWQAWVNSFAPSARSEAEILISKPENFENNTGILTVSDAVVLSKVLIDDSNVMKSIHTELNSFFKSGKTYACYLVETHLTVNEDNGYFSNGVNSFVMTLVKENNIWSVGAMYEAPDDTGDGFGAGVSVIDTPGYGTLVGFATVPSCKAEPASVNVKAQNNVVYKNIPFDDYLLNVIYNEINGFYPKQAEYAHIICVKTFTWCFYVKKPFGAYGYDINHGFVSYTPTDPDPNSEAAINIMGYIEDMKPYYMTTSNATGNGLFYSDFTGDPIPADGGKGSGELYQRQAKKLASGEYDGKEYTWREILHYFYDNSTNDQEERYNVGIVQFFTQGSHTFRTSYSTSISHHWRECSKCESVNPTTYATHTFGTSYFISSSHHWRECSKCEYVNPATYQAHVWRTSTGGNICTVCGAIQNDVVNRGLKTWKYINHVKDGTRIDTSQTALLVMDNLSYCYKRRNDD